MRFIAFVVVTIATCSVEAQRISYTGNVGQLTITKYICTLQAFDTQTETVNTRCFCSDNLIMVRNYKRTSTRGQYGNESLGLALRSINTGTPLLVAAREFNIPARTLRRHRDGKVANPGVSQLGRHRIVLSTELETELHHHVQYMEKALYGLTTTDVRRLAYDVAEKRNLKHPFSHENRMAGKTWLSGFLSRHQDLSIRAPQGTNLSRAVGFNKPKVQQFFEVYRQLLETHDFSPARVWNMDKTGITNVHKPGKVLATKGTGQVGKMTSGERGKTVTVICAMNATGVYVPPMIIFPRQRMVDALMTGAPPQAVGYASPSGWTDSDLFVKWLEHFATFTNATRDAQHIIILDGHHSHKTLAAVTFAREHGINLLTLPPHSTHKMQPLDRTYFKSLKSAFNAAADSWMVANPGKRISFFDMAGIFGKAFLRSATPEKAVHGFLSCGIWPYDENIFSGEDFAASMVTDQDRPVTGDPTLTAAPSTDTSTNDNQSTNNLPPPDTPLTEENRSPSNPSPVGEVQDEADVPATITGRPVSPHDISDAVAGPSTDGSNQGADASLPVQELIRSLSPLPKLAVPRSRKRKSEEATLLTASPYKDQLLEKEALKMAKEKGRGYKGKSNKGKGKRKEKGAPKGKALRDNNRPSTSYQSSDEDEEWPCIICAEPFVNSRSKEVWVQCISCLKWAHEECTPGDSRFVCPNCESDVSDF